AGFSRMDLTNGKARSSASRVSGASPARKWLVWRPFLEKSAAGTGRAFRRGTSSCDRSDNDDKSITPGNRKNASDSCDLLARALRCLRVRLQQQQGRQAGSG